MDISAFFAILRRRALIIGVAVVVGAAVAYVVAQQREERYTTTSKLLLRQLASVQLEEFSPPLPETATDREALVLSGGALGRAQRNLARRYGQDKAKELLGGVESSAGTDSDVIDIEATAPGPAEAAATANAVASANVQVRRDDTLNKIRRARRQVERQRGRAGSLDVAGRQAALGQIENRLQQLNQSEAVADGAADVVQRASAPSSPSSPRPNRDALVGAFAGLFVGLGLALVREQVDRRVKHSKELGDVFGLPVLTTLPQSRALRERNGKPLTSLPPAEAEAFQMLRANLHYLNTDKELRSVVVTSASVGDGKTTVALNLAKADAAVGRRVLLVEADIRRPSLAPTLGLQVSTGLASFLSDRSLPLTEVTHRVPVSQRTNGRDVPLTMDVVVAGTIPSNPSELIDSERMRELIREAEGHYDLVVIDTAPAGLVADAIPLMSEASAVVIVGRVGRVTSSEAHSLREQLERIDAPAFGLVANFSSGPEEKVYGYY